MNSSGSRLSTTTLGLANVKRRKHSCQYRFKRLRLNLSTGTYTALHHFKLNWNDIEHGEPCHRLRLLLESLCNQIEALVRYSYFEEFLQQGRFEIVSLSGSYVRNESGGRTGGLSVCLSSTDGQIVGGGVGGPLKAAGPVQVIVGTFLIDTKKNVSTGLKNDASGSKLPSTIGGTSVSSVGFRSPINSSGRNPVRGNDDYQPIGGSHFMIQSCGMNIAPSRPIEWRSSLDARSSTGFEIPGRAGHGAHQSPENGDYDQIPHLKLF
ncbi:hypothetical protein Ddye_023632 [Dipteronia dyeriana]|uniref:AT-hook motif nuclear-localized protein n=1 Tax=Dipteronia dyeriana TaxID=168575 RepID=A0AAD9TUA0_9ROSI|nr:hypothetical protein Ddye_023632 [Dipteronia dyeriana]